eukprot:171681-Rhodomonas_salina.2
MAASGVRSPSAPDGPIGQMVAGTYLLRLWYCRVVRSVPKAVVLQGVLVIAVLQGSTGGTLPRYDSGATG